MMTAHALLKERKRWREYRDLRAADCDAAVARGDILAAARHAAEEELAAARLADATELYDLLTGGEGVFFA